ncbi:hypothetical protein [Xanthomonas sp. CFBP 8445]|nr:hypothetical protein [Xanthomonas sp. CFBP 8445]UYC14011.1 hypothetical protein NUG21_09910 [Xanthomonas sp. CFBP 8445]
MHNPDWSQFSLLDHLIACALLALYLIPVVAVVAAPLAIKVRNDAR